MQLVKIILATLVLAVSARSIAQAGTKVMASAPAVVSIPGPHTIYCDIANIGDQSAAVTIEIMNFAGGVVSGPHVVTVAPSTAESEYSSDMLAAWCRFTVDGSTRDLRATAIYENGTHYTMSLPAY